MDTRTADVFGGVSAQLRRRPHADGTAQTSHGADGGDQAGGLGHGPVSQSAPGQQPHEVQGLHRSALHS